MEKEICRRHLTREGIGCVWVFMNMFDFRHGGSNQKLLMMDKKRGSKRLTGGTETKVDKQLTCDCDYEEEEESESGMHSVKRLIEEEIEEKTHPKYDNDCKKAKNRKRKSSRTLSQASEDVNVVFAEEDGDDHGEKPDDSVNDDSEEKFSELIKRLIAQKEKEIESCKNNTFQVYDTNEVSSPSSQTIVILKPDPNGFDAASSPPCKNSKNKRFGSRFILSRISRRLKSSIRKNPCNAQQHDSDPDQDALSSNMSETIETTSRLDVSDGKMLPSIALRSEDKKKSMCGIYIAAKKHLSEMLAEGDIEVDLPDKEVPRILGKILALPEFSTPESSPRMTSAHIIEKAKIHQESSEDYSELDSNKHASTTGGLDTMTVLDSSSESVIQQDGYVDEEDHQKLLEKSSPVSVLEPFFTDDDTSSPYTSKLQPLCIRFDELDSPRQDKDMDIESTMDDKELALAYIQSVVRSSELNWEELLVRSYYSEQVLEQALMDDIEFFPNKLCADKNLLFDCINEVVTGFYGQGPWISFVKPDVLLFPEMENAVEVVQEEVYWHLLPLPSPHTLDQIVKKELARKGSWMDLRFDVGCIGIEAGDIILDQVLEEIISDSTELFLGYQVS